MSFLPVLCGFPGHFPFAAEVSPGIAVVSGTFSLCGRGFSWFCCCFRDISPVPEYFVHEMPPKQGCFAAAEYFVHELPPTHGCFAVPEYFVHEMPPKQGCFPSPEYFVHEMPPKQGCFPEPEWSGDRNGREELTYGHKKRVSLIYRTATTAYPCYLPVLGEFCRSWSYMTYPGTKVEKFL